MFNMETATILGSIAGLVLTILVYIKIMPKKFDGKFENPWFQKLHDLFQFKKLYLEEVLKFLYVLATIATVCMGAFMLLGYTETYSYYSGWSKESTFLYGLLTIVAGPISIRLAYEVLMMFVLLVKNTIEINNKMKAAEPEATAESTTNMQSIPASVPGPIVCPICGAPLSQDATFCTHCGNQLR